MANEMTDESKLGEDMLVGVMDTFVFFIVLQCIALMIVNEIRAGYWQVSNDKLAQYLEA